MLVIDSMGGDEYKNGTCCCLSVEITIGSYYQKLLVCDQFDATLAAIIYMDIYLKWIMDWRIMDHGLMDHGFGTREPKNSGSRPNFGSCII